MNPALPIDLTDPRLALGLIVLVVLEALVIASLAEGLFKLRRQAKATEVGEGPGNLAALYSKALTGSLDRFSVGEVLQFLNSIRETGILDILDDQASAVHRLLLEEGDIIDAYNGDKCGERVVQQILGCTEGSFTFIRGDLPSHERVIHKPTMTLLMETFQLQDETNGMELVDGPLFAAQG